MPEKSVAEARQKQQTGELGEAESICREILKDEPENVEAMNQLASVLRQARRLPEAISLLRKSLEMKPAQAAAHADLGTCLIQSKQAAAAVEEFRAAVAINPSLAGAQNNLGACLRFLGRYEEAVAACKRALELRPNYAHAMTNLGAALCDTGRVLEAIPLHQRAIELDPELREPHWNLAMALLRIGDLKRGFAEYEWRLKGPDGVVLSKVSQPRWDGGDLREKTILLHGEQGMGDIIQFIRYAPLLAARGGKVALACHAELVPLLATMPVLQEVVPFDAPLPACDVFCPTMSLPALCGTTSVTIPAYCPYLYASREAVAQWSERLGPKSMVRVGLVGAGRPNFKDDALRSIKLQQLSPLAALRGFEFHSLQKGPAAAETKSPPPGMRLIDHAGRLSNFAETAALIANLDVVVSVDTAVAHLAGALGKSVFLMLPVSPDWRWMLQRSDSPWYPTMTLFRQSATGEWTDVIGRVAEALATGQRRATAV
jgi:tetratricopeptide (TPR) repeat protein